MTRLRTGNKRALRKLRYTPVRNGGVVYRKRPFTVTSVGLDPGTYVGSVEVIWSWSPSAGFVDTSRYRK